MLISTHRATKELRIRLTRLTSRLCELRISHYNATCVYIMYHEGKQVAAVSKSHAESNMHYCNATCLLYSCVYGKCVMKEVLAAAVSKLHAESMMQ